MNKTEHLLACLAEECAEVQHAVAKALRFGLDDGYPGAASTNAQDIAREFADVLAFMLNVLVHMDVNESEMQDGVIATMMKNLRRLEEGVNVGGVR